MENNRREKTSKNVSEIASEKTFITYHQKKSWDTWLFLPQKLQIKDKTGGKENAVRCHVVRDLSSSAEDEDSQEARAAQPSSVDNDNGQGYDFTQDIKTNPWINYRH